MPVPWSGLAKFYAGLWHWLSLVKVRRHAKREIAAQIGLGDLLDI